ncbi:MAG: 2-C-methyl-D-erythritol 4-phosphate cytidylyltransferase [Clostridia bacterium]|nr:2-C-methyl-D-erythritol 4-phosphate cytidylyltransferase [Clostridia bacterium]
MNIALIVAGGSGRRMGQDIPKQFININDKPVLIYTLENFQKHPQIDGIILVCIDGWHDVARAYAKQFGITKLLKVISGGETVQESIFNGVKEAAEYCNTGDIVVIHDGIRPMVDATVLSDVILKATQHGNAVTSMPYNEQIFIADDEFSTLKYIPRDTIRRVSTPQAYEYNLLKSSYEKAFAENIGIGNSMYTNTMMADLGVRLYFAAGSDKNIKLTTKDDLELFKSYLKTEVPDWLK